MPQIIVKFKEGMRLAEREGTLVDELGDFNLNRFNEIVSSVRVNGCTRSYSGDMEKLRGRQTNAGKKSGKQIPSLDLFVRIDYSEENGADKFLEELNADPAVEYAVFAHLPAPPPDARWLQGYKSAAPDGIDTSAAELFDGGAGHGVKVCVCEYGFEVGYVGLPMVEVVYNQDGDLTYYDQHGSSTLGVLFAVGHPQGVSGICHQATAMFASESRHVHDRPTCINEAIENLDEGDVLVLEMQAAPKCQPSELRPAETDPDVHAACVTAAELGIIVVAAAGNSGRDLGETENAAGKLIWNKANSDDEVDSGAIIVGAGAPPEDGTVGVAQRGRLRVSCFGARVNCHAWGDRVATVNTHDFHGTSAATAIIAGAVACLQGIHKARTGTPISPARMRELFSDVANGTPQADVPGAPAATQPIGPLPDLAKLIAAIGASRPSMRRSFV